MDSICALESRGTERRGSLGRRSRTSAARGVRFSCEAKSTTSERLISGYESLEKPGSFFWSAANSKLARRELESAGLGVEGGRNGSLPGLAQGRMSSLEVQVAVCNTFSAQEGLQAHSTPPGLGPGSARSCDLFRNRVFLSCPPPRTETPPQQCFFQPYCHSSSPYKRWPSPRSSSNPRCPTSPQQTRASPFSSA